MWLGYVFLLNDFAARALPVRHSLSIFVGILQFTEEANDLVAIVAFFRLHGKLTAYHARGLVYELLLKLIDRV